VLLIVEEKEFETGKSNDKYWFVSILEVTTKNITNKKTISISGVISIFRARSLLE
jgi:hypothetical protein